MVAGFAGNNNNLRYTNQTSSNNPMSDEALGGALYNPNLYIEEDPEGEEEENDQEEQKLTVEQLKSKLRYQGIIMHFFS